METYIRTVLPDERKQQPVGSLPKATSTNKQQNWEASPDFHFNLQSSGLFNLSKITQLTYRNLNFICWNARCTQKYNSRLKQQEQQNGIMLCAPISPCRLQRSHPSYTSVPKQRAVSQKTQHRCASTRTTVPNPEGFQTRAGRVPQLLSRC